MSRLVLIVVLALLGFQCSSRGIKNNPPARTETTSPPAVWETEAGWIPFEFFREGLILVRARVQGRSVDVVIDSGASFTVLSQRFAEQIGIEGGEEQHVHSPGGTATARWTTGIDIEFPGHKLSDPDALVFDLSGMAYAVQREIPVVIGRALFESTVVKIDYPNRRIAFCDPQGYAYDGDGQTVSVSPGRDGWQAELGIEGLPAAPFLLDTGDNDALSLNEHFVREHNLLGDRTPRSTIPFTSAGGECEIDIATLRGITFAGYGISEVPASFNLSYGTTQVAGTIGNGLLERFLVIFDVSNGVLYVEPSSNYDRPFWRDRAGFIVRKDNASLVVKYIAPGSPAESAGWQVDERITAIDGEPIDDSYWQELYRWSRRQAGTKVLLTDGKGQTRQLVLADYY